MTASSTRILPANRIHNRLLNRLAIGLFGVVLLMAAKVNAASGIQYQFDNEFGAGTPPSGPAPWITTTIENITPGTVQLTIANNGLLGGEFVSGFYLNLNTNFSALNLSVSYISSSGSFTIPSIGAGTIERGTDSFKAGGDGKYDLLFDFSTIAGSTFGSGESVTFQISGIAGLTANDFAFLSAPSGGFGPFYAAAHIQGIGADSLSGWIDPSLGAQIIPVPEPSSAVILALSLGALGIWRRSKVRNIR